MNGLLPILFFLFLAVRLWATEPLRSVAQIRALGPEQAAKALPACIEGVVTYTDPKFGDLFVKDPTGNTFVGHESPTRFQPGDRIRVEGVTGAGAYYSVINAKKITLLGHGPLPETMRVDAEQLFAPSTDSQWVEVPAMVTGVEQGGRGESIILLKVYGRKMKATMPAGNYSPTRPAELMQRHVRLQAVAGTSFNFQRQMTGRFFLVPSFDQMTAVSAPVPRNRPELRPVTKLLWWNDDADTVVLVDGVVTQSAGSSFYLRDSTGGLLVHTALNLSLPVGAHVRVEGVAEVAPFRPVLNAHHLTVSDEVETPLPFPLSTTQKELTRLHAELVSTDATFLALSNDGTGSVLKCHIGERYFDALLPGTPEKWLATLQPGALVRLTGVCELFTNEPTLHSFPPEMFRLLLPAQGGVQLLRGASWWTLRKVLLVLGMVSGLALLSFIWVWLLRRRVQQQTQIIGENLQRVAVLNERERIAQDLHDSVEQELTGVLIHLGGIAENLAENTRNTPQLLKEHSKLELAQRMLRHCREETRNSVRNLRSLELEERGLAGALQEMLPPTAELCGARFEFQLTGEPRPLDSLVEHHLLRMAQESVANAAHHAAPKQISVHLSYQKRNVTLETRDDGKGFNPAQPPPKGHFGLSGLRQRADKIKATFRIESAPGKGTLVRITLPQ